MDEDNNELIPKEGSEGVGIAVAGMLEEIIKYREDLGFAERCNRFYKLRRNKHWKNNSPTMKLVSANLLGTHHRNTVNMLTDNSPTFNAIQAGDMGEDGQDALSLLVKTTDSWYNETEQQHVYEESAHIGELYGTVGEFLSFDPDINFPEGEVDTETLDPLYYSLYPPRCKRVEKAEGFIRWYPKTVREARREWPDQAEEITGDLSLLADLGDERHEEQRQNSTIKQTILNSVTRWLSGEQSSGKANDSDELFIIEAWVKDYSELDDGSPAYPGNIRRVKVCNAGDVVLSDDYNPSINPTLDDEILQAQYLYNRFPCSHTHSVTDPSSPFGLSDFEQLEQLNVEVNKCLSQFNMFKDKVSRPKLMNPLDSGVSNEELDNRTGIIRPTNYLVSQAIRFMDSPQMPTDVVAGATLYKNFFNEVAGSFSDVTQGQKSGSDVIAAKAIAMLLEQANRMARGKVRNYSKMLRERGRMFLSLAQSWYDTPRYITFQRKGKDETVAITREQLQISGKINIVSGSTMPVSEIQRREEALGLYGKGVIDQEELLKRLGWDNYTDVVERMAKGPLGAFIDKLSILGMPPELAQLFQQVGGMEQKEVEAAIKSGKMMQFPEIIKQLSQEQPEPKPDPEMIKAQIAAQNSDSDAKKAAAEIALIEEKILTERTERDLKVQEGNIKLEGLRLDNQNMTINKAKAVAEIKQGRIDAKSKLDKGRYAERGLKSNNKELKA